VQQHPIVLLLATNVTVRIRIPVQEPTLPKKRANAQALPKPLRLPPRSIMTPPADGLTNAATSNGANPVPRGHKKPSPPNLQKPQPPIITLAAGLAANSASNTNTAVMTTAAGSTATGKVAPVANNADCIQQPGRHQTERYSFEDYLAFPRTQEADEDNDSESAICDPLAEAQYLDGIERDILLLEEQHLAKNDTELDNRRREEQQVLLGSEAEIEGQKRREHRKRPCDEQPSQPNERRQHERSMQHPLQGQPPQLPSGIPDKELSVQPSTKYSASKKGTY
jgi:hypothetical protein